MSYVIRLLNVCNFLTGVSGQLRPVKQKNAHKHQGVSLTVLTFLVNKRNQDEQFASGAFVEAQ